jgi:hypothetical protein
MALEDGRATNLYISVQPAGALFDPPLAISFPNLDGQSAGAELLLMSFDHDAGRYVRVGTARVSADGRTVESVPGSGIRVGAWHAAPPSPPGLQVIALAQLKVTEDAKRSAAGLKAAPAPGALVGKHIDEVIANVYGTSAVALTPREAWHDTPEILLRASFQIPRLPPAPQIQYDVEVQVSDVPVELVSVTFKENYRLKMDTGAQSLYPQPEWNPASPSTPPPFPLPGTPPPPYVGDPIAYQAGKKMKLKAMFKLAKAAVQGDKARVKVDGNEGYDLDLAKLKYDNKTMKAELEGSSVKISFPKDTINYYGPMSLKWSVALDGKSFEDAGNSANPVYVTLGEPNPQAPPTLPGVPPPAAVPPFPPLVTVVDLATRGLQGLRASPKKAIFDAIWGKFPALKVTTFGGKDLRYWGVLSTIDLDPLPDDYFSTEGLVKNVDGRCGSWQIFFTEVLRVQGIAEAHPAEITPMPMSGYGPAESGILVGPGRWEVDVTPTTCRLGIKSYSPAQSNLTPGSARFRNHAVVCYEKRIYDPSYGREFNNLTEWEQGSLEGLIFIKPGGVDCAFKRNSGALETNIRDDTPTNNECAK